MLQRGRGGPHGAQVATGSSGAHSHAVRGERTDHRLPQGLGPTRVRFSGPTSTSEAEAPRSLQTPASARDCCLAVAVGSAAQPGKSGVGSHGRSALQPAPPPRSPCGSAQHAVQMDRGHGCTKTLMLTTASVAVLRETAPTGPEKVDAGALMRRPASLPPPYQRLSPLHPPLPPRLPAVCVQREHRPGTAHLPVLSGTGSHVGPATSDIAPSRRKRQPEPADAASSSDVRERPSGEAWWPSWRGRCSSSPPPRAHFGGCLCPTSAFTQTQAWAPGRRRPGNTEHQRERNCVWTSEMRGAESQSV